MLKLENTEVMGWKHAIRGMRNPKNSWERSDTVYIPEFDMVDFNGEFVKTVPGHYKDILKPVDESDSFICESGVKPECSCCEDRHTDRCVNGLIIGPNDHSLMMSLAKGGPVHAKYRRMIAVYVDITAPLYWWKEFDTYKVGTVANSCSTMHKIADKEFTLEDFSCEHLIDSVDAEVCNLEVPDGVTVCINDENGCLAVICKDNYHEGYYYQDTLLVSPKDVLDMFIIPALNANREAYLKTNDKKYWWQMIQLLPSSYNQRRTVMTNYEVLAGIYPMRKDHKLNEWHVFCDWIEKLPYSEIIIGES